MSNVRMSALASTASFKLLVSDIIWDDRENKESNHWGAYHHDLTVTQAAR